ncbi:MAG: hypothetical protein Q3982_01980 [Phoenicibacter congonensis]|uniref:Uncharacterized protein n=1 Tax=Phoenicibacter congonensis TaxID=1944646 RepID=A0AA43RJ23_9ACTN|nr:hypothetical protein [Phoenicibacter congonensis]
MTNSVIQTNKWCDICTVRFRKKLMNVCAVECTDISYFPKQNLEVSLVPPKLDFPRKLTIKAVNFGDDFVTVTFKEKFDKFELRELDGMHLLVASEIAQNLEQPETSKFVGWTIKDAETGHEYVADEIIEMPTQLLAICNDGDEEIQIILHDDLIVDIDDDLSIITVTIPSGCF